MANLSSLADQLEAKSANANSQKSEQGDAVFQPTLSGLTKGITGVAGIPGDILKLAEIGAQFVSNQLGLGNVGKFETSALPTSSALQRTVSELLGSDYLTREANTPVGRVVSKGIELGTTAAIPATGVGKVARAANPILAPKTAATLGASSGISGQTTAEVTGDPLAGAVVELGTGLLSAAPSLVRRPFSSRRADQMVREAEIGDPDLRRARELEQASRAEGVPLTVPELIDSNTATSATATILSQPEASRRFGIDQLRRDRMGTEGTPSNVRAAVEDTIDLMESDPIRSAADTARVAENIIRKAIAERTRLTEPFFIAARDDKIAPETVRKIVNRIDDALVNQPAMGDQTSAQLRLLRDQLLNKTVIKNGKPVTAKEPLESAATLYNVYKNMRDRIDLPATDPNRVTDTQGVLAPILDDIKSAAIDGSENIAAGHKEFIRISRETIDPLNKGIIGRVSKISDAPAINAMLSNVDRASSKNIKELVGRMLEENPAVYSNMVKEWLSSAFEKAAKPTAAQAGKTNFKAGAAFDIAVRGARGSEQRAKFDALLDGLATAYQLSGRSRAALHSGWSRLLNILERTARLPGEGSPTAGRAAEMAEAGDNLPAKIGTFGKSGILGWWTRVVQGREYGRLADALGTKGGIDALIKLGREKPTSKRIGALSAIIATSTDALTPEE